MTPRQIRALEWAVSRAGLMNETEGEYQQHMIDAQRAVLQAWHDYRTSAAAARTTAPRRALQRVGAK